MARSSTNSASGDSFSIWREPEPETGPEAKQKGPPAGFRARARRYLGRLLAAVVVLLFLLVFLSPDIFVVVHAGEVGVLYQPLAGGTQADKVVGEGLQAIAPWDTLTIYNIRVQEAKHEIEVLTREGLGIRLHLSVRYHPEPDMVGMLHKEVGPDYKERIVLPEVESALRIIMGGFTMHQVYGSERGVVQKVINESLEGVSQKFVRIDDLILRRVELPPQVRQAIEEKMKDKELAEAYEYRLERERLEAQRKEIEANGIKRYNEVLDASITPSLLRWRGIEATRELSNSPNSKVIIVGNKSGELPLLLGGDK